MKEFIMYNKETLKNFRITGTNTTIQMVKMLIGAEANFGPACTSGPLGGDAQIAAQVAYEDIGAVIFFIDPLSAHPHQADIDSLLRLLNVHNILVGTNPTSGQLILEVRDTVNILMAVLSHTSPNPNHNVSSYRAFDVAFKTLRSFRVCSSPFSRRALRSTQRPKRQCLNKTGRHLPKRRTTRCCCRL